MVQEAVSNIVRHARATSARISIHFMNRSIKVSIEDNGRGFQPEEAMRSQEGMRGLGLAIVQDIIKMHGGRMEIRSAPGEGTKVVLCFPAAAETAQDKPSFANP